MNYVYNTPGQRGINYKITDKSKVVTSPAADVETFDGFFIIHTEKGPVNTIYPKLTYAQLVDVFGDINPEKHGLHTLAAYNFANAGNTVTVIRVDKDAKLANMTTKIKLTALEKEVLIYKGTIINASEADITAGMHNEIANALGISNATLIAGAKKITLPIYVGETTYESLPNIAGKNELIAALNAGVIEAAGQFGLQNVTIYPFAFIAEGEGKWGNKVQVQFTADETLTAGVATKNVTIKYDDDITSEYSSVTLVPNVSDEYGIMLNLATKLNDKVVINNKKGDLNLKLISEDANTEAFEEAIINYYIVLLETLAVKKTAEEAKDPDDKDLVLIEYIEKAIEKYTIIYEKVLDGDITPLELFKYNGTSPFEVTESYNLISLNQPIVQNRFKLMNGKDGLVEGMRKFNFNKSMVTSGGTTVTLEDLYVDVYDAKIDKSISSWNYVTSVVTFDIDFPIKIKQAIDRFTKHGTGLRGDIVAIGGAFSVSTDISHLTDFNKSFGPKSFKYFLLAESCEVKDTRLNKTIRVPMALPLIDTLTSWYNGNRRNPVTDYSIPSLIANSVMPKILTSDEVNTVLGMDLNIVYEVAGTYKLYSQSTSYVGQDSRLKELHNAINFAYLIKDAHVALRRYGTGLSETSNLRHIQEKLTDALSAHGAWFESAPVVTVGYKDDEAQLRGQVSVTVTVNMFGTIKSFDLEFIVDNAAADSTSSEE